MAENCSNCRFCESKIVCNARKAVAESVRGNLYQSGPLSNTSPDFWQADVRGFFLVAGKHKLGASKNLREQFKCHRSQRPHGRALFAVSQANAFAESVDLRPSETFDFTATAARESQKPNGLHCLWALLGELNEGST